MKNTCLLTVFLLNFLIGQSQLKVKAVCPPFEVDVMSGTVNELSPKSSIGEIKSILPCFTNYAETDSATRCAGVFYSDKAVSFFTERRYIEVGERYKGKLNPALLGVSRNNLFKLLGYPKLKDTDWEAFQMGYGTLILYYNKAGRINKIQMSSKGTDSIKLCE